MRPAAANPECVLVGLWLRGRPWAERVDDVLDPEQMEDESFRALFEALRGGADPEMLPAHLVPLYEDAAAVVDDDEQDAWFDHAVKMLRARPIERRLEEIRRELPLCSDERKSELAAEYQRLTKQRNAILPRFRLPTPAGSDPLP